MNKKALLACLLVMTMLLSSCALVVTDEKVDAATPIITVGDTVYTKSEVQASVTNYLNYVANQEYQNYGFVLTDINSDSAKAQAQDVVINALIEEAVVHAKSVELGVDKLSDEELAEIDELVDLYWEMLLNYGLAATPSDITTDEQLAEYKDAALASIFGENRSTWIEEQCHTNLRNLVTKDVTVTDEEIKAEYDNRVQTAMVAYGATANPNAFGIAYNGYTTATDVYYQPAGYRYVKNIVVQFSDADQAKLTSLRTNANTQQNAANSYKATIEATGANADQLLAKVNVELTEVDETTYTAVVTDTFDATDNEEDKALIANVRSYAEASALAEKYNDLANTATAAAFAAIDATADEVLTKLEEGADWDEVMAEYTSDPGMQGSRPSAKTGYAVCEGFSSFETSFVQAAMALQKVGDYSAKIASEQYGYFIIQYAGDVVEGEIGLDNVSDTIKTELLSDKKSAFYDETVAGWVSEAKAVVDKKPLN